MNDPQEKASTSTTEFLEDDYRTKKQKHMILVDMEKLQEENIRLNNGKGRKGNETLEDYNVTRKGKKKVEDLILVDKETLEEEDIRLYAKRIKGNDGCRSM